MAPVPPATRTRRTVAIIASYACAGGLLTLIGWFFGVPRLTDWEGNGIAQMANNAVAVFAAGAAIVSAAFGRFVLARALAIVCAVISGATLLEHATGLDLHVDTLLVDPAWGQKGTMAPGRMGLPASIALTVVSCSAFMLTFQRARSYAVAGGLLTMAVSMLSLIGYAFGADPLYSIPRYTAIALQTSTMLLALGAAVVASVPDLSPMRLVHGDSAAALLVRRTLPAIILLPVLLGFWRVRAQNAGFVDTAFGTALLVLSLMALLLAVLFWSAAAIFAHESVMRQSRDRLAAILGSITDPFMTVDGSWSITFLNAEAEQLVGRERAALLGCNLWDVLDPTEHGELRRSRSEGVAVEYEIFVPSTHHWILVRAYPKANGGLAIHARDITERRAAEETLRRSADALRAADRMKDEFLATLSHELRTPLTSIVGWSQILLSGNLEPREQHIAFEAIRSSAKAQSQLIEDVLDVSRIVSGQMRLERAPTDLASVIEAAAATVQPAAEAKRITVKLSLDRNVPRVFADRERLQQVVWNLLSNAIKFSRERTTVEVVLRMQPDCIEIEVIDEGSGIASDFMPHIFERFRQADSSSARSHAGLGLGLALVKDLTELHGGTVSAQSEKGRGSRFTVRLPLPSTDSSQSAAPPYSNAGLPKLDGVRVLYVDDRADARLLISTMLQQHGAEVVQAQSVVDALAVLAAQPPDVVVTDLAMPERDGFDLIATIRTDERWHRLPVLALTAQGRTDDEARAAVAGFRGFLRKPIESEELAAAVARAVNDR